MNENEKARREIEKAVEQFKYCVLRQRLYSINFKYENEDFLLSLSFSQNSKNYNYNVVSLVKLTGVDIGSSITGHEITQISLENLTSNKVFDAINDHFTSELIKS